MANQKGRKVAEDGHRVDNEQWPFEYQPLDESAGNEMWMFSKVRREREMSAMVSALTHVVTGDDCVRRINDGGDDNLVNELMDDMNVGSSESSLHGVSSSYSSPSGSSSGHKRGRNQHIQTSQEFSSLRGNFIFLNTQINWYIF